MQRKAGKKSFMAKAKRQKAEAKRTTVKDMDQDYRLKKVEKATKLITGATIGYKIVSLGLTNLPSIQGNTPGGSVANMTPLFQVAVGDDNNLRQGSTITARKLIINGSIVGNSASGYGSHHARVMVFCINNPGGIPNVINLANTPRFSDILQCNDVDDNTGLAEQDIFSSRNLRNGSNIHIYYDKTFYVSNEVQNPKWIKDFSINIVPKRKNAVVEYNSPGAVAGGLSIKRNQWFVAFFTNAPAAETQPLKYQYKITQLFAQ